MKLNAIAFRSHSSRQFGPHFLTNFTVFGISDDHEIECIGNYKTTQLMDYEVSATFPVVSSKPIRSIRIVSNEGQFGLSIFELFGLGSYNECKTGFTKDFLTNPSTYENVPLIQVVTDNKKPYKSLMQKLFSNKKKKKIIMKIILKCNPE